jgi:hypothetical protein
LHKISTKSLQRFQISRQKHNQWKRLPFDILSLFTGSIIQGSSNAIFRVAPSPISTGISFRQLPRVSLTQLRKICDHYETKGKFFRFLVILYFSGAYLNEHGGQGKACRYLLRLLIFNFFRYLFEFSREVQSLLDICEEEAQQRTDRIKYLELLFNEWEEIFTQPLIAQVKTDI